MTAFDLLGRDLRAALARRRARRRRLVLTAAAIGAVLSSAAIAGASIGVSLSDLDPTKWTILHRGTVERGEYVHARENATGGETLFIEEHDAGLSPYATFLLHERNVDKAVAESGDRYLPEQGPLCTAAQLTDAEQAALAELPYAGAPCRGLRWAAERVEWVGAGREPESHLMPGAR